MKFIISFLLLSTAHAESYKIAGDLVQFKNIDGLEVANCSKSCEAIETVKKHRKIDLKKVRAGMDFTNSVGSDVCAKVYKAGAFLGTSASRDRRAFCYFKDKSMIEMNSLSSYLLDKKIVKE